MIEKSKTELIWSPYPRDACTIILEGGIKVGFGVHPIFDLIPGAWNIFWLTFSQLDRLAYYNGDHRSYVVSCDALAVCVGAALQAMPNTKPMEIVGNIAAQLSPTEFIGRVANFSAFLPVMFYGERWFNVAYKRASTYVKPNGNIIHVDFREVK